MRRTLGRLGARLLGALAGLLVRLGRRCYQTARALEPLVCTACGRLALGLPNGWAWIPSVPYRGALVAYCPACHGDAARAVVRARGMS